MAWTTSAEVIAAWIGDDAPTDTAKVDVWIGKAERLLRAKVPGLQARIDAAAEPDLEGNVQDVVTAMVQRVFRNPEGIRQRQEGTGPFTGSVTYGGDQPGTLSVTSEELATISPVTVGGKAFAVDLLPASSPYSPFYGGS